MPRHGHVSHLKYFFILFPRRDPHSSDIPPWQYHEYGRTKKYSCFRSPRWKKTGSVGRFNFFFEIWPWLTTQYPPDVEQRCSAPISDHAVGHTVILQIFSVVLFSVFSVVNGFTEIKKTPKCENTLSDHDRIHRHRNLNYTERSVIARHRNFNAPKICKITVHVYVWVLGLWSHAEDCNSKE